MSSTTFAELLRESLKKLQNSPTPELDSKVLLKKAFSLDETRLFLVQSETIDTNSKEYQVFQEYIQRRLNGEPIAYICKSQEFYGNTFYINESVLIPRPETEWLIDHILAMIPQPKKILELGTGSGCIPISLSLKLPQSTITATDISINALQVAKKNATMLTEEQQITFLQSNLTKNIKDTEWDVIVANLPYLSRDKHTDDSILHEPDLALYADQDGLEIYFRLLREISSRRFIFKYILLEMMTDQASTLKAHIEKTHPKMQTKILEHPGKLVSFLQITQT